MMGDPGSSPERSASGDGGGSGDNGKRGDGTSPPQRRGPSGPRGIAATVARLAAALHTVRLQLNMERHANAAANLRIDLLLTMRAVASAFRRLQSERFQGSGGATGGSTRTAPGATLQPPTLHSSQQQKPEPTVASLGGVSQQQQQQQQQQPSNTDPEDSLPTDLLLRLLQQRWAVLVQHAARGDLPIVKTPPQSDAGGGGGGEDATRADTKPARTNRGGRRRSTAASGSAAAAPNGGVASGSGSGANTGGGGSGGWGWESAGDPACPRLEGELGAGHVPPANGWALDPEALLRGILDVAAKPMDAPTFINWWQTKVRDAALLAHHLKHGPGTRAEATELAQELAAHSIGMAVFHLEAWEGCATNLKTGEVDHGSNEDRIRLMSRIGLSPAQETMTAGLRELRQREAARILIRQREIAARGTAAPHDFVLQSEMATGLEWSLTRLRLSMLPTLVVVMGAVLTPQQLIDIVVLSYPRLPRPMLLLDAIWHVHQARLGAQRALAAAPAAAGDGAGPSDPETAAL